jgi:thymidine phosphorylase
VLGGGRSRKGDAVDVGVGVELHAKVGDEVTANDGLATLWHRGGRGLEPARRLLEEAYEIADAATPEPLIIERGIGSSG